MRVPYQQASDRAVAATQRLKHAQAARTPVAGLKDLKPTTGSVRKEMHGHKLAARLHSHAAQMAHATMQATGDPGTRQILSEHAQLHINQATAHVAKFSALHKQYKQIKAAKPKAAAKPQETAPPDMA